MRPAHRLSGDDRRVIARMWVGEGYDGVPSGCAELETGLVEGVKSWSSLKIRSSPISPRQDPGGTLFTTKSTFSASVTRSNLTVNCARSHTFIIGL